MDWTAKLKAVNKREERLFAQNTADIDAANGRMLLVVLYIGLLIFAVLWCLTYVLENYEPLRTPYLLIAFSMLAILLLSKLPSLRAPACLWLYCTFSVYAADAMLSGVFTTPNYVGVMILACLFQLPVLTLDYSWRIDLVELVIAAVYLVLVVPHKAEAIREDEMVNVIFFTATALSTGGFLRRARLGNFELERRTQVRETTDYLTGLGNRRKLFEYLSEKEKADSAAPITGLLMLDIDNFKLYNDTYGHLAGDECLRRIGACMRDLSEKYPVRFFRYGGEEFLGTSCEFNCEELYCFCEELTAAVRKLNISNTAVERGRITVSVGITAAESSNERKYEQMISEADSALYEAKRTGRDKVVGYKLGMSEAEIRSYRRL